MTIYNRKSHDSVYVYTHKDGTFGKRIEIVCDEWGVKKPRIYTRILKYLEAFPWF